MKYLFPFIIFLLFACKKDKPQSPDGERRPKTAASLTGAWMLDAVYGSGGGTVTWVKAEAGGLATFTADSGYMFNKVLDKDHFQFSINGADTILKIYKKGYTDTLTYTRCDVFKNTLYLYIDGITASGEKYIRQQ